MKFNKLLLVCASLLFSTLLVADEIKVDDDNTELNFYTGMFDFSDDTKRAGLIGFQHQNENLNRDTFLGNLSPITGGMITDANATYFYTGVQAQYTIGAIEITPSFAPGYYN